MEMFVELYRNCIMSLVASRFLPSGSALQRLSEAHDLKMAMLGLMASGLDGEDVRAMWRNVREASKVSWRAYASAAD